MKKKEPIRKRHPWSLVYTKKEKQAPLKGFIYFIILIFAVFYGKKSITKNSNDVINNLNSFQIRGFAANNKINTLISFPYNKKGVKDTSLFTILFACTSINNIKNVNNINSVFIHKSNIKFSNDFFIKKKIKNIYNLTKKKNDNNIQNMVSENKNINFFTSISDSSADIFKAAKQNNIVFLELNKDLILIKYYNKFFIILPNGKNKNVTKIIRESNINVDIIVCSGRLDRELVQTLSPEFIIINAGHYKDKSIKRIIALNNKKEFLISIDKKSGSLLIN